MKFYKVGPGQYVNEDHIERVEFKTDGSAVLHTTTNNITVIDKEHVNALKDCVGVSASAKKEKADAPPAEAKTKA